MIERLLKNDYIKYGTVAIVCIGIVWLACYLFRGGNVSNHGGTTDGVRIQLERIGDRQYEIARTSESLEQRINSSSDSAERIEQSNSSAQMAIERIKEGNSTIEGILERDARIIEQSRGILESIRQTGQGTE